MNAVPYRERLAKLVSLFDESQVSRDEAGKFASSGGAGDSAGVEAPDSSIIGKTSGINPADKETWYRNGGGWNRAVDGERPYGWDDFPPPNYEPPDVAHTPLRMKAIGLWGGSHGGSSAITGEAATTMGLPGYRNLDASKEEAAIGSRMLEEIAKDATGSEERLFHTFENVKKTVFAPGDTLRLPLLAASGKPELGYAHRGAVESQHGMPIVFAFPKGTPMVGYSTATKRDAADLGLATVKDVHKEFGHVWDEAIIAGGFAVERVETVYMGSQHRDRGIKEGEPVPQLYGQVVHLKPTEVYDPTTKTWRPRG